jgi:hypothetical protein
MRILAVLALAGAAACSEIPGVCESRAHDAIWEVVDAQTDLSCAADADCSTVGVATRCSSGCSVLANRAGAARIQAAVDDAQQHLCGDLCPTAEAWPCPSGGTPRCRAGRCTTGP